MKLLPIGISDFKEIIDKDSYYVDKTLLVKELLETGGKVVLMPRPRRFGKTLNLSMLKYFFEKSDNDNSYLFKNTEIWKYPQFKEHQGKYPVIFLTFKDVKEINWEKVYYNISGIISEEFLRHKYVLSLLDPIEQEKYNSILSQTANSVDLGKSIFFLSKALQQYHNNKVIILIDEYDAPIHAGYNNNFYKEVVDFMRSLLSGAFKDNSNLQLGVLTGILRTAKEGIFSGLNNLEVASILSNQFQDKFGFTIDEVKKLLDNQNMSNNFNQVQQWYNGYTFGKTIIYNPWSIISFVKHKDLKDYWGNTSDNQLIKKLITQSQEIVKEDFELLISNNPITKEIDEGIIFPGIENNPRAIWSLLLFTGYLTYKKLEIKVGITYCDLIIPNQEIMTIFTRFVKEIFEQSLDVSKIQLLFKSLTTGDIETFEELLQEFIINSMSCFDFNKNEPEKSYHLLVLGLLVMLAEKYEVKSNRESGLGRYDIMLIPKNKHDLGIIIEFKKLSKTRKETLKTAAQSALEQIQNKKYDQEFQNRGINQVKALGIAFQGKQILVLSENLSRQ